MKKIFFTPLMALLALFVLVGCSSKPETREIQPKKNEVKIPKSEINISMKELENNFHEVEDSYYGIMETMSSLDQLSEKEAGKTGLTLIKDINDAQKRNKKLIQKLSKNKASSPDNKSATQLIITFTASANKSLDTIQDAFKDAVKGKQNNHEQFEDRFNQTVIDVFKNSSRITKKFFWEDSPKAQKFLDDIRNSEEDDSQEDGASSTEK